MKSGILSVVVTISMCFGFFSIVKIFVDKNGKVKEYKINKVEKVIIINLLKNKESININAPSIIPSFAALIGSKKIVIKLKVKKNRPKNKFLFTKYNVADGIIIARRIAPLPSFSIA